MKTIMLKTALLILLGSLTIIFAKNNYNDKSINVASSKSDKIFIR